MGELNWNNNEKRQMKKIHAIYKYCLCPHDDRSAIQVRENQTPEEDEHFLPSDSPLRTEHGENPHNPPFKTHDQYLDTLDFNEYWLNNFHSHNFQEGNNSSIQENARAIVEAICNAQAQGEVRASNGSVPFGRFFRDKRDRITPLALVLHELKHWAAKDLRQMRGNEKNTQVAIDSRIDYVNNLKDTVSIFGPPVNSPMAGGMRVIHHNRLHVLLAYIENKLIEAKQVAKSDYDSNSSREKFCQLHNLLHNFVIQHMRTLSNLMALDNTKGSSLDPMSLVAESHEQQASTVDFQNIADVCFLYIMRKMPLFRAVVAHNYKRLYDTQGKQEVRKSLSVKTLKGEATVTNQDEESTRSLNELDEKNIPRGYKIITAELKLDELKDVIKRQPLTRNELMAKMTKMYRSKDVANNINRMLQEYLDRFEYLLPACYGVYCLHRTAGQYGDFGTYEVLKEKVIKFMMVAKRKVQDLQSTSDNLQNYLHSLCQRITEKLTSECQKNRRIIFKQPAWIDNVSHVRQKSRKKLEGLSRKLIRICEELETDAKDFIITPKGVSDDINRVTDVLDVVIQFTR
jgi:hypothetical protein